MQDLGYHNVHVYIGDGTLGCPQEAPFDAIVVTAAAPKIPTELMQQLSIGGRLVIPVGDLQDSQQLVRTVRRGENDFDSTELGGVRFVPLIGVAGWEASDVFPGD